MVLPEITVEGTKRQVRLQAAVDSRTLASVKRTCEAGHSVVFDYCGSFVLNKGTGEINMLQEDGGSNMVDFCVLPTNEFGFGWPSRVRNMLRETHGGSTARRRRRAQGQGCAR